MLLAGFLQSKTWTPAPQGVACGLGVAKTDSRVQPTVLGNVLEEFFLRREFFLTAPSFSRLDEGITGDDYALDTGERQAYIFLTLEIRRKHPVLFWITFGAFLGLGRILIRVWWGK
jgi:hypothetical protein